MFPHTIHLTDGQAGGEKTRVDLNQIAFLEPRLERQLHARGAAAGDQEEDLFVPVDKVHHLATGGQTLPGNLRMTSANDSRMAAPVSRMRARCRSHSQMWRRIPLGNRREGFAEIADSIEQSTSALSDCHHGAREVPSKDVLHQALGRAGFEGAEVN